MQICVIDKIYLNCLYKRSRIRGSKMVSEFFSKYYLGDGGESPPRLKSWSEIPKFVVTSDFTEVHAQDVCLTLRQFNIVLQGVSPRFCSYGRSVSQIPRLGSCGTAASGNQKGCTSACVSFRIILVAQSL